MAGTGVLRCAATGADAFAYVQQSFTATDEIWVTASVYFDTAALAVWNANFAEILDVRVSTGAKRAFLGIDAPPEWYLINGLGSNDFAATAPTAGSWHTLEVHWNRNVAAEFYLNSSLEASITAVNNAADQVFIGLVDTAIDAASILYVDDIKVGTTRGGIELFTEDFEGATPLANFTFYEGDVTVVSDPLAPPPAAIEGVSVAFNDTLLEPDPTWTRIDNQVRVRRWEVHRGRQDEREKTNTAEATVFIADLDGDLDPSNTGSPWFGLLDGKQLGLARWNPVTSTWSTRFRGYIEEYGYDLHPSQLANEVAIRAVGFMDYEANAEMAPGVSGHAGGPVGLVFYDNQEVNDRINKLHLDAGLDTALYVTFSGNVFVQESIYDPGYSYLAAIQDAADAEFPGVANVYEDRFGRVVFHGRHARFDPDTVAADAGADAWTFTRWKVGDGAAITGDADYAQLRPPLASDRSLRNVINAALATPLGIKDDDVAGQLVTDPTSIGKYGVRSWSAQDLRVLEHKTNGNTALQETYNVASYYVTNQAEPITRPRQLTVKSLHPDDPRATKTWAYLCGVDISDVVHLKVGNPGGGGFDDDFYVEGITESSEPLGPFTPTGEQFALETVVVDVSPTAWYTEDTFPGDS